MQESDIKNLVFVNEATAPSHDIETVTKGKHTYIEGMFMESEVLNGNNRGYDDDAVGEGVAYYKHNFIDGRKSIGEMDHPADSEERTNPLLSLAALRVVELYKEGRKVFGKAKVLNTPEGRTLLEIIEEKIAFGISHRSFTALREEARGVIRCGRPLFFRAWDAVLLPSVGVDLSVVNESISPYRGLFAMQNGILTPMSEGIANPTPTDIDQDITTPHNSEKQHITVDVGKFANALK